MSGDSPSEDGNDRPRTPERIEPNAPDRGANRLTIAAASALVVLIGLGFTASRDLASDDVYITYTFARNLAEGHGFSWAGEPSLGTTSPLLALVLAALERLVPLSIPVWGHLLTWISVSLLCATLLEAGRREDWLRSAAVASLLFVSAPIVARHVGFEWFPAMACLVGAMSLFARGRTASAGALLALASAFRSEAAIAPLPFSLAWLATRDRRGTVRQLAGSLAVAGSLVLIWLALLQRLAGTVVPTTLAAKRAQAASGLFFWRGGFPAALATFWDYLRSYGPIPSAVALTGLLVAGALIAARTGLARRPTALFLLAFGPLVGLALVALGVPIYSWYAIPLTLSATLLVAMPAEAARPSPASSTTRQLLALLVAAAVLMQVSSLIVARWHERRVPGNRKAYLAMARAADRFPRGTRLGAFEVGDLGWFSRQPVVDLLGLVTADVEPEQITRREFRNIRDRLRVDLIVFWLQGGPLFQATFETPSAFYRTFELEATYQDATSELVMYRRLPLTSRNGVEIDLTALAAKSEKQIRDLQRKNRGGFVVVLEPAEELAFELAPGDDPCRFETWAIGLRGRGTIRLLDRSQDPSAPPIAECEIPMGSWSRCSKDFASGAAGRSLAIRCTARRGTCGLLAPLVRRIAE